MVGCSRAEAPMRGEELDLFGDLDALPARRGKPWRAWSDLPAAESAFAEVSLWGPGQYPWPLIGEVEHFRPKGVPPLSPRSHATEPLLARIGALERRVQQLEPLARRVLDLEAREQRLRELENQLAAQGVDAGPVMAPDPAFRWIEEHQSELVPLGAVYALLDLDEERIVETSADPDAIEAAAARHESKTGHEVFTFFIGNYV